MVDIKAFIDSMKLAWMKRLMISNAEWTHVTYTQLPDAPRLLTYGKEKLSVLKTKIVNIFYKDLIEALIRFSTEYKPSSEEILSETIWFSDHTQFSKTIIKGWERKGFRFICNLFIQTTGKLYSREEIESNYQIQMALLCYETIIRSLPQCLRSGERTQFVRPNIPYKINTVMNKHKFSKYAYNIFVESLAQKHIQSDQRIKDKWEIMQKLFSCVSTDEVQGVNSTSQLNSTEGCESLRSKWHYTIPWRRSPKVRGKAKVPPINLNSCGESRLNWRQATTPGVAVSACWAPATAAGNTRPFDTSYAK